MVITANPPKYDKRQPSRGAYDYIVYKNGSKILAEDSNGQIVASGTVAQTVINAAIVLGGKVVLAEDVDITGKIVIANAVEFCGINKAKITMTAGTNAIMIDVTAACHIHDLELDGTGNTAPNRGINVSSAAPGCIIEYNYIHDCYDYGVWIGAGGEKNLISHNKINTIYGTNIYIHCAHENEISFNEIDTSTAGRGISLYPDATETGLPARNNRILNNKIKNVVADIGYGIYLYGSRGATVSGNECSTCRCGIKLNSGYSTNNNISANVCHDCVEYGITLEYYGSAYTGILGNGSPSGNSIVGNTCESNTMSGILLIGALDNVIMGNTCNLNTLYGIQLIYDGVHSPASSPARNQIAKNICMLNGGSGIRLDGATFNEVSGNDCINNNTSGTALQSGIYLGVATVACSKNVIEKNTCTDTQTPKTQLYGIMVNACPDNTILDNYLVGNSTEMMYDHYWVTKAYQLTKDDFMDVLAESATAIRAGEDLSATVPITFTITNQPDVPRNLTWALASHAQITAFTLDIRGITAFGSDVTESFTQASGWSGATANAFAKITSVKLSARTGTGAGDTANIGTSTKLGLCNRIQATADVITVKKNTALMANGAFTPDITHHVVDVGSITAADNFEIRCRINRNTVV
ncbi:MAG: right-handed parallel beta-helix repeat-containing protein [Desulfobacterales bacterium]|nr:right-handed parallel beta-helix repeat-containing protein [Desulfobacterales bacterium]